MNKGKGKQQGLPKHFLLLITVLHHINTTFQNSKLSKERMLLG